jgi:hypothetical protein
MKFTCVEAKTKRNLLKNPRNDNELKRKNNLSMRAYMAIIILIGIFGNEKRWQNMLRMFD